jgi:hypothetical protein
MVPSFDARSPGLQGHSKTTPHCRKTGTDVRHRMRLWPSRGCRSGGFVPKSWAPAQPAKSVFRFVVRVQPPPVLWTRVERSLKKSSPRKPPESSALNPFPLAREENSLARGCRAGDLSQSVLHGPNESTRKGFLLPSRNTPRTQQGLPNRRTNVSSRPGSCWKIYAVAQWMET